MRVYIIEYRFYDADNADKLIGHSVSQEGYASLEAAQKEIEKKPDKPFQVTPMLYKAHGNVVYVIHDILIMR